MPTGVHPLPALKTYKSWDDNSTICQRAYAETSINNAVTSLIAMVQQSSLTHWARTLAKEVIQAASLTLSKLFMFMDRFYGELTNTYGTDSVEAWRVAIGQGR
jgi:hypothetical protein